MHTYHWNVLQQMLLMSMKKPGLFLQISGEGISSMVAFQWKDYLQFAYITRKPLDEMLLSGSLNGFGSN